MQADTTITKTDAAIYFLRVYWKIIFALVWPTVLFPILFTVKWGDPMYCCYYTLLVMLGYWFSECVPPYVTGMLPVMLFPLFGILSTAQTCLLYFNNSTWLLMIGFFIATALEYCGLQMRLGLMVIKMFGTEPRFLSLGLMTFTAGLSLWLPNVAVTTIMFPVLEVVLKEMDKHNEEAVNLSRKENENENENILPTPTKVTLCYYLGIAYAASIGGVGTLVGSPTNTAYKDIFVDEMKIQKTALNFTVWSIFNLPLVLINLLGCWLILQIGFMGLCRSSSEEAKIVALANKKSADVKNGIEERHKDLGPWTWHQVLVLIIFCMVIILWSTMHFVGGVKGWADLYTNKIAILVCSPAFLSVILFFAIPHNLECCRNSCSTDPEKLPTKASPGLVGWKVLCAKMPWGIIFTLGGGFALLKGGEISGLTKHLAQEFKGFGKNVFLSSLLCNVFTEVTANATICAIVIPILLKASQLENGDALVYTFCAAINCSYAMILSNGTPTIALLKQKVEIPFKRILFYGGLVKLLCLLFSCVLFLTYGKMFL